MNKLAMVAVMAVCSVVGAAWASDGRSIKIGGVGKLAFVNASGVDDSYLKSAAAKISNILLIETEVKKGSWSLASAKKSFADAGASAVVFVVDDPGLPMSLIAMEEKWGVANSAGLDGENAAKEALRVATVVLGGASSKYSASVMRPVFSRKELGEKAGSIITIDSLMAIYPNLSALGIKQYSVMDYADALEDGVAPPPANDVQRKIKADFDKSRSGKK